MMRVQRLDQIGPAVYGELNQLTGATVDCHAERLKYRDPKGLRRQRKLGPLRSEEAMSNRDVVRSFVRGEVAWSEIPNVRITVTRSGAVVESDGAEMAVPDLCDVATGFLNTRARGNDLREWAAIVLAASGMIDLSALEGAQGELLLNALWDASAGKEPSAATWAVVQRAAWPAGGE